MTDAELTFVGSESRSLENPSTPFLSQYIWNETQKSVSKVPVSYDSALTYAAIWRAVNLISRDVSKLPLFIYRREGEGKEKAREHPAFRLLRYKPNDFQTAFSFWFYLVSQALLRGNGYALIRRNLRGEVADLIPMDYTTKPSVDGGMLVYEGHTVFEDPDRRRAFSPAQVLHVKGYSSNGYEGDSVITRARETIGLGLAAKNYGAAYFGNGARPGMVLQTPEALTQESADRVKQAWEAMFRGSENSHKTAVLESGMEAKPLGMSNEDSQFVEHRAFEIREIANFFSVPPHKLGDPSRTSFSSLEQENQAYLDDALDPWLITIEQECREKVLSQTQRMADSHVIQFNRKALVRSNMTDRSAFYTNAIQWGWMNVDEIRNLESMNPLPDGEGQKFLRPLNMTTTDEEPPPEPSPEPPPEEDEDEEEDEDRTAITELLESHLKRIGTRISRQAKGRAKDPDSFFDWVEVGLEKRNRGPFLTDTKPVARVASVDVERIADDFFAVTAKRFLEAMDCDDSELSGAVDQAARLLESDLEELSDWMLR